MTRSRILTAVGFTWLVLLAIATAVVPARAADVPGSDAPASTPPNGAPPKGAPPKGVPPKFVPVKPAVAVKTLTQKGLTKLKPTPTAISWVLADDVKTCEKLADFYKVVTAQRVAAKKAKEESAQISKDRETLSKAEARYSELKGYNEKPDTIPRQVAARFRSQQEMMQALQQDLNDHVNTINKLRPRLQGKFISDMPASLKAALTDWMLARNNLILAYPAAKADFSDLDKRYKDLADDADVTTALRSLGKKNHLGSPEFEQAQKAIAETEATATSGDVPFYREGPLDSVAAILNETLPIAIRIESVNPQAPSWAPTEVLTKAGITIDPAAPMVTLNFTGSSKRTIQCRQVVVPKLRFGKYVLENLKFLAMPDDAKDLGIELANSELKAYDQTADRETWLYKFAKQDQPKPDDDKTAKPTTKSEEK